MNYFDVTVHYPGGRYEVTTVETDMEKVEVAESIATDLAESGLCIIDGDIALIVYAAESIGVSEAIDISNVTG